MVRYNALKGLYETEKTIGCGGFAKVKLATHLATGEKVAIKIMDKKLLGDDLHRVTLELQALKNLNHDNICQLYQVIETDSHFFIVMEYCSGGELFDHIVEKNRLSESESRMFFRQIVSAVAYLHSLGYAHRDLKPENVLLDKHQNLKLIDFGLCAKPEGGMENPLHTSCGSPTYAAPELILGQKYLGQEVDVWAMGVLLYALLTGSLPFDDLSIDSLYKKILSGKYHEPHFISKESKSLIRSMLQVEPSKRIKVSRLLNHSWLTLGILEPVDYRTKSSRELDTDCVQSMARFISLDEPSMRNELNKWRYDYSTVTYFLLLHRKRNGQNLRLNSTYGWKSFQNPYLMTNIPLLELPVNISNTNNLTPTRHSNVRRKFEHSTRSPSNHFSEKVPVFQDAYSPSRQFLEPIHVPAEAAGGRKAVKRPRSSFLDDASPVPSKKLTPRKETPSKTPDTKKSFNGSSDTPGSARRMLGSLERSLHKVKHVLTPKKSVDSISSGPAVLNSKELFNVSTTQCNDPEFVIAELSKALEKKGIVCTRKGFRLKGCLEPNILNRLGGCSFELEICFLPELGLQHLTAAKSILKRGLFNKSLSNSKSANSSERNDQSSNVEDSSRTTLVGIRRKRLKGDAWCYKKVCEQVLALTSTGLQAKTKEKLLESSV